MSCAGEWMVGRREGSFLSMRGEAVEKVHRIRTKLRVDDGAFDLGVLVMDHYLEKDDSLVLDYRSFLVLGIACLHIGCKVEETFPPCVSDFLRVSKEDLGFSCLRCEDIILCQDRVLQVTRFGVSWPLPHRIAEEACFDAEVDTSLLSKRVCLLHSLPWYMEGKMTRESVTRITEDAVRGEREGRLESAARICHDAGMTFFSSHCGVEGGSLPSAFPLPLSSVSSLPPLSLPSFPLRSLSLSPPPPCVERAEEGETGPRRSSRKRRSVFRFNPGEERSEEKMLD